MCIIQCHVCDLYHASLQCGSSVTVGLGVILVLGYIGVPVGMIITGKTYIHCTFTMIVYTQVHVHMARDF